MAELIAPATGKKIGEQKEHNLEYLHQAVKKAKSVQRDWAALPFANRKKRLLKIRTFLIENSDTIAETIAHCTGKTVNDAFTAELFPAVLAVGYYLKQTAKSAKPKKLSRSSMMFFNKHSYLHHEPYGVIGVISPWNYPFGIPFHEVFLALAAGNAVILKVATQVQPVGELFTEMMKFAGIPDGLFSLVHLSGSKAGPGFIHSGIDKLFFTGSVAIGRELMKEASSVLLPLSLELGGNDAMIVCDDANLERAAAGAVWGGLSNAGQSCGGVERIYVHSRVYDQFMKILCSKVKQLRPGAGFDADLGFLTTKKQKQTVQSHIKDALEKGAVISASSPETEGAYFHPAVVLEHVTHEMDVMKHETFGPVLGVCKFDTLEQALTLANDSYLGLTASVWSKNRKKAERIACTLQAGAITVNDHLMSHGMAETPWGGHKMSSIGRSHGGPGLEEVFQAKVIIHDSTHFLPRNIWWHPYSKRMYNGLKNALSAFFAKTLFSRIIHLIKLAGFYLKRIKKQKLN